MALIAAHLNAGVILVMTVYSDRYILSLFPHLHTHFPAFSPSLISLVVSVDVKHHVDLGTLYLRTAVHRRGQRPAKGFGTDKTVEAT